MEVGLVVVVLLLFLFLPLFCFFSFLLAQGLTRSVQFLGSFGAVCTCVGVVRCAPSVLRRCTGMDAFGGTQGHRRAARWVGGRRWPHPRRLRRKRRGRFSAAPALVVLIIFAILILSRCPT